MISPVQAQIFHKYVEEKDLQTFRFYPDRYVLDIWAKMTAKMPWAVRDLAAAGWNNLEMDEALCQLAKEHISNGGCVNCKMSGDRNSDQDADRNRDSFSNPSHAERAGARRGVSRKPRARSKAGPERQGHTICKLCRQKLIPYKDFRNPGRIIHRHMKKQVPGCSGYGQRLNKDFIEVVK